MLELASVGCPADDDGLVDGAPDEDAPGELSDLDGGEWLVVAGVTESVVECEELLEAVRNVERGKDVICEEAV